jgi:hypothetical protein
MRNAAAILCLSLACALAFCDLDSGLVASYQFDEKAFPAVRDGTGHGFDGTATGGKLARNGSGRALELDKPGEFVECAADKSLGLKDAVSLEVWACPAAVPGSGEPGIAGQGYESFVLTYYTDGNCWWYIGGGGNNCHAPMAVGVWHHLVGAFDGTTLRLYIDGVLAASRPSTVKAIPQAAGFLIGKNGGDPGFSQHATFNGLVGEVRLYDRALSTEEIAARYRTSNLTHAVDLSVLPSYYDGTISVQMGLRGLGKTAPGTRLELSLVRLRDGKRVVRERIGAVETQDRVETTLRVGDLEPGPYNLTCSAIDPRGQPLGEPTVKSLEWPKKPSWPTADTNVRVLNNLVTELLSVQPPEDIESEYSFTNPRRGWVYVRAEPTFPHVGDAADLMPEVRVRLDGHEVITQTVLSVGEVGETMRFIPAGVHRLRLSVRGRARCGRLIVRAVPTLAYCQYRADPHVAPFGPYDISFLRKYVLPQCNTIIAGSDPSYRPVMEQWKQAGGQWIVCVPAPGIGGDGKLTADEVEKAWRGGVGMQDPLADGIIVDEFGPGEQPQYAAYTEALRRIAADPKLKAKLFIPYTYGGMWGPQASGEFIRTVLGRGWPFADERYLPEQRTEFAARASFDAMLRSEALAWEKNLPGSVKHMLVTLGYFSAPNESLDVDPGVDWKVCMDMQFQMVATDPAFFGVYGVQWYLSSYADEEVVRFAAKLFQHYGIEGHTERYLKQPYLLPHIRNADFEDGLNGWQVAAATDGGVTASSMSGFSWLEGRYPQTSQGDTFARMTRSAGKPNVISQKIKALQPGKLYALRMFSANLKDMHTKQQTGVSIDLAGVEPVAAKGFDFVAPSCYAHTLGDFDAQHPAWFTYHFRVFKAKGAEATISISDWRKPNDPGGPAGQETAVNFVEIQPYMAE